MTGLLEASKRGVRVKVCCIASIEEAELALEAGADALGLVSAMPSGPGVICDEDIATIARWVGSRAATVLLTSRLSAGGIDEQLRQSHPSVLQICDALPDGELEIIRAQHPGVVLMPVVHVRDDDSVTEAVQVTKDADAILLDSGNPRARVKELGGTGRVHDWRVSRAIRDAVGVPLFLAGGLRADNVAEAVRTVRPFGVDVCSGVRRAGKLDRESLARFVTAAREAM
jgi:phosphoribosylanthranilate isomerase